MVIHKCDSCGKEIGVWINANISIGATRNETNVGYLTPFITSREYCVECAKEIFKIYWIRTPLEKEDDEVVND